MECRHGKKGTFLSKATIARSAARPKCRQLGFARGAFDPGIESPEFVIGTVRMTGTTTLLIIFGDDVLSVLPPEESGGPFRINADLRNRDGTPVLRMVDNVIEANTANWDVEVKGSRIIFRSALRDVSLVMRSEPGERIVFERLKLAHRGCKIDGQEGKSISIDQNGTFLHAGEGEIFWAEVGIDISNNGVSLGTGNGSGVNGVIFESLSIGSTRVPPVKLRKNSKCSCGSGRRFKHCHGAIAGLAP